MLPYTDEEPPQAHQYSTEHDDVSTEDDADADSAYGDVDWVQLQMERLLAEDKELQAYRNCHNMASVAMGTDKATGKVDYVQLPSDLLKDMATEPNVMQDLHPSAEKQLMTFPEQADSTGNKEKKLRELRKAFSKMMKACKAAVASLNCFGKQDQ